MKKGSRDDPGAGELTQRKRHLVSVDDGAGSRLKKAAPVVASVAAVQARPIVSVDGTVTVPGKSAGKSKGFAAMNLSPQVCEISFLSSFISADLA